MNLGLLLIIVGIATAVLVHYVLGLVLLLVGVFMLVSGGG